MVKTLVAQGTNTPKQILTLHVGINKIGRRLSDSHSSAKHEVLLQTNDVSIHRQYHCQIEVVYNQGYYDYILSSYETASNPTLLGEDRIELYKFDSIYILEGMVFYIGEDTKLCLST